MRGPAIIAVALVLLSLVASCGYRVQKGPAITEVRLGEIENRTSEPGLDRLMYEALTLELNRNGIRASGRSGYVIGGSLDELRITSIAEKAGVDIQYNVGVTGDIRLTRPDATEEKLSGGAEFIVTYYGEGELRYLIASRDTAIRQALKNLAESVVMTLRYAE